jgi:hypothetical protein
MLLLRKLFSDDTEEKFNRFVVSPASRVNFSDESILTVIFAFRTLNDYPGFKNACHWAKENRPELMANISRGIIVTESKFGTLSLDFGFKVHQMNDLEHAFSLITVLESRDDAVFDAIFENYQKDDRIKLFEFLVRLSTFKLLNDSAQKVSGDAAKRFVKSIEFLNDKLLVNSFKSVPLQKIRSFAFSNVKEFKAARGALDGLSAPDVPLFRTQVDIREACADGDFKRAQGFQMSLIDMTLQKTKWQSRGKKKKFDTAACLVALRRAYKILDRDGIDPFLVSGTLLGMVRDGKIFDHDKDFDIAVIGWEKQFEIFRILYTSGEFDVDIRKLLGDQTFVFAARHRPTNISFDVFLMRQSFDKLVYAIDFELGFTMKFLFTKFDLEVKMFGEDCFRIPANSTLFLSEKYGEGWAHPDPGYDVVLKSPAIVEKSSDEYKTLALDRILRSVKDGDLRGLSRKINYLRGLDFAKADLFYNYIHEFNIGSTSR